MAARNTRITQTPWGEPQEAEPIAPGVTRIETAGHGGYHLTPKLVAGMPHGLGTVPTFAGPGWYEEDCDWALVALAYPTLFPDWPQALRCAIETAQVEFVSWRNHPAVLTALAYYHETRPALRSYYRPELMERLTERMFALQSHAARAIPTVAQVFARLDRDFSGVFDGNRVTSDADPGL